MLGITGEPVVQHVASGNARCRNTISATRAWSPRSGELCAATPGIFLTGNYLAGPSMGACVEHANKTAAAAAQFLRTSLTQP